MNYHTLVANISRVHQEALSGAAGAVNRHLLLRNWLIGAHLVEFEQRGWVEILRLDNLWKRTRLTYHSGLMLFLPVVRRGAD